MGKRKAKNQFELYAAYIAMALGLIGLVLYLFLPVTGGSSGLNGLNLIFGKDEGLIRLKASPMLIVTFALVLGGLVVSFLVSRRGKKGGLFAFVAAGAFILAAVFTFLSFQFAVTLIDTSLDGVKLGVGIILPGILYALSGAVLLIKALF